MPPAHPRSRGENPNTGVRKRFVTGSSPLTRGKHAVLACAAQARGLIPAHAGKTARVLELLDTVWAHPRSRGENAPNELEADFLRGSSPLTRGKRMFDVYSYTTRGLIPAHAGKTHDVSVS